MYVCAVYMQVYTYSIDMITYDYITSGCIRLLQVNICDICIPTQVYAQESRQFLAVGIMVNQNVECSLVHSRSQARCESNVIPSP